MIVLAVVISTVLAADIVLTDDAVASYAEAFEKYQVKFGKHYETKEEYDEHLRAYATSMERIKEYYKKNPDSKVVLGETSRSDFIKPTGTRRTVKENIYEKRAKGKNTFPQPKLAKGHTKNNIPTEFNWFNVSGVKHPARNQGKCGSCWSFAATGALEMQSVLAGNEFVRLSVEQGLDCTTGSKACCGGFERYIYDSMNKFVSEESYPYELAKEKDCPPAPECRVMGMKVEVRIHGYDEFNAMTAQKLKEQIWMYGPVSIDIDCPDELTDYLGGVFDCKKLNPGPDDGHAVIAVGFGEGYFAIRNSWGKNWGLEGDFLLSDEGYQASCHLLYTDDPPYPQGTVTRVSVVGPPEPSPESTSSNAVSGASAVIPFSLVFVIVLIQMQLMF